MHCITTGKGMGSFQRIFFRNDFHRMFLVGSDENFSVNSMRDCILRHSLVSRYLVRIVRNLSLPAYSFSKDILRSSLLR